MFASTIGMGWHMQRKNVCKMRTALYRYIVINSVLNFTYLYAFCFVLYYYGISGSVSAAGKKYILYIGNARRPDQYYLEFQINEGIRRIDNNLKFLFLFWIKIYYV